MPLNKVVLIATIAQIRRRYDSVLASITYVVTMSILSVQIHVGAFVFVHCDPILCGVQETRVHLNPSVLES